MKTINAVQPYTLLRGIVGSSAHGLHLEGQDDIDQMAVAVEPPEFLIGLARAKFEFDRQYQQGFEHHVERTQPEGARSGPGDLDRTTFSLRKWMRLATAGNPTVLLLLFVPEEGCDVLTPFGRELRGLAPKIISKQCGPKFLGYLSGQKQSMLGLRTKKVTRTDLIDKYGWDVKYGMHAIRLAIQGIEIMEEGRLTLPMKRDARALVRSIREGKMTESEALDTLEHYESELRHAVEKSKLPDNPDYSAINRFLIKAYYDTWGVS
jgi:predicted nucleotidyltransferase